MLWLQYAYAKYNNYQRMLEVRESSFARWKDERRVSAYTNPYPFRGYEKILYRKVPPVSHFKPVERYFMRV